MLKDSGLSMVVFKKGEVYQVPEELAEYFIKRKAAVISKEKAINGAPERKVINVDENK